MENGILVIPDVHGREFWEKAVEGRGESTRDALLEALAEGWYNLDGYLWCMDSRRAHIIEGDGSVKEV